MNEQSLRYVLLALIAISFLLNLSYGLLQTIWNPSVWHPVDEIAHYDYIDNLSSLRLPDPEAEVSAYTQHLSITAFGDYGPDAMGLAGISYQAQQPLFYYALLAVPNSLLKSIDTPAKLQLLTLRSSGQVFLLIAAILIILSGRELQQWLGISELPFYLLAAAIFMLNIDRRYAINPDNLSLCINMLSLWCLLRFWRVQQHRWLGFALLAATLAVLTKYTNGLVLLLVLGVLVFQILRQRLTVNHGLILSSPSE